MRNTQMELARRWVREGITSSMSGLTIAPEDFILTDPESYKLLKLDYPMDSITRSRCPSKTCDCPLFGKRFFTWHEAMLLENEYGFPPGWRLPTYGEAVMIVNEFGKYNSEQSIGQNLIDWLKFEPLGTINFSRIEEYNMSPCTFSPWHFSGRGGESAFGGYWLRDSLEEYGGNPNEAYILRYGKQVKTEPFPFEKNYGVPIRLVTMTHQNF
ncbi:MAG: hypothetical protein Q4E46_02830 [Candidatus Saccharibacteria bacterium]|nr:hypothetical protein [Candidatus Saccharibacteria bacterium]